MPTLEKAITLAATVHEGQTDKAGAPYILHPLRVMLRMSGDMERMAAVLHDVVEDSDVNLDDLRDRGFPEAVVAAVDALTRRPGESYEEFIRRAGTDPVARAVKLADLEDNLDMSRLPDPTDRDRDRMEKYRKVLALLQG